MSKKMPEEVLRAVSIDFKLRGMTHETAAEKMGFRSKQTLSNLLSSKKYLSGYQARRFNEAFGYNMEFLMRSEGQLIHHEVNFKELISELAIKNSSADMVINSVESILLADCLRSGEKEWITATNCDEDGKKIFYLLGKSERPDFHDRFARWLMAGCPYV